MMVNQWRLKMTKADLLRIIANAPDNARVMLWNGEQWVDSYATLGVLDSSAENGGLESAIFLDTE